MEKLHPSFWKPIDREWQVARELAGLVKGRPKFLPMVAAMYAVSFIDPRRAAAFRASYVFTRYIDDIADGDRPSNDPTVCLEKYQRVAATETNDDGADPIASLLLFSVHQLEKMADPQDNVRKDYVRLINAMAQDRQRSQEKRLLTQQELGQYYWDLFTPALNLSLLCAGSKMRAHNLPEMVTLQGRLYSVRDLAIDWPRGIYNIPSDIILSLTENPDPRFREDDRMALTPKLDALLQQPQVKAWIREEKEECRQLLPTLKHRLKTNGDQRARLMCALPVRELTRIANSN